MALIIKGDMPSCCAVCCDCNSANDGNFCNRTGNRLGNDWQLYRPLNCPIIGWIPDKHGDLVDRDKLRDKVEKYAFVPEQTYTEYMMKVEKAITDAPVILEASR